MRLGHFAATATAAGTGVNLRYPPAPNFEVVGRSLSMRETALRLLKAAAFSIFLCSLSAVAMAAPGVKVLSIVRLQPGWVRVYLQATDPPLNPQYQLFTTCGSGTSASSITTALSGGSNLAFDIKDDLNWLADNGLPTPCHITQINVSMIGGGLPASATANVDIAMDLPLSYLTPDNTSVAPTGTSVSLAPSTAYAAYPPLIVVVKTLDGHTAFVEVEELLERATVGVRGVATFFGKSNTTGKSILSFELGGGGEIFDGWGLDVVDQGIWRAPQSAEEITNAGHDKFTFSGSVQPPFLATPVPKVFPAPPLFTSADYNANVLNNRGVPRCFDTYNNKSTGCMAVTYDQKHHVLNAVNGAQISLLTPPDVSLENQVSTQSGLLVKAGAQPTPRPPGSGAMVKIDDPTVATNLLAVAKAMAASSGRDLTHVLAMRTALGSSRAPTRSTVPTRDYTTIPLSPQELKISQLADQQAGAAGTIVQGPTCVVTGGPTAPQGPTRPGQNQKPVAAGVSMTPNKCAGMHSSTFACPTQGDAIAVENIGTGNNLAAALTGTIPPYYAGRDNHFGTCASHAATQFTEALLDKYTDDLAVRRTIYVNNDPVVVPMPRVALSVSGGTAQYFDWDSTHTGDPPAPNNAGYPANTTGYDSLPNFPDLCQISRKRTGWRAKTSGRRGQQMPSASIQTCVKVAQIISVTPLFG